MAARPPTDASCEWTPLAQAPQSRHIPRSSHPGNHRPGGPRGSGCPRSNVFYRKLNRRYPRIVRGEGCYLFDADGRRYLDGSGGAFVANLGHGEREIAAAMAEQAGRIGYLNGTAFTHDPVEQLGAEIAALMPAGLDLVYPALQRLGGGGGRAQARAAVLGGERAAGQAEALGADAVLSREHPARPLRLRPPTLLGNLPRLAGRGRAGAGAVPVSLRVPRGATALPGLQRRRARGRADRGRTDTVAAFIAEPVGGSSTGLRATPGYWRRVRQLCDRYEVLWVADEVLTGAGRTGTWSALEPYGAVADIVTLGKGIAGGYVPLSAQWWRRVAWRRSWPPAPADCSMPRRFPIIPYSAPPASPRSGTSVSIV